MSETSKRSWTPGPWYVNEMWRPPIGRWPHGATNSEGNIFWGYSIGGSNENGMEILPRLASVHNFPDNIKANANLISAAPELYEALDELLPADWRDGVMDHMPGVKKACAALARARGEED